MVGLTLALIGILFLFLVACEAQPVVVEFDEDSVTVKTIDGTKLIPR